MWNLVLCLLLDMKISASMLVSDIYLLKCLFVMFACSRPYRSSSSSSSSSTNFIATQVLKQNFRAAITDCYYYYYRSQFNSNLHQTWHTSEAPLRGSTDYVFKVMRSKVSHPQWLTWKSCGLHRSWTTEGIWTKTYINTYHSRETNCYTFSAAGAIYRWFRHFLPDNK